MTRDVTTVPTIELWGLLLVPLQGEINDALAERISEDVLDRIHHKQTRGLVIDVTGLWMMDSHLCSLLSRLASSAQLMGTDTLLCGLSPEIALTLQTMGLELHGVQTKLTLEEALEEMGVGPTEAFGTPEYEDASSLDETLTDLVSNSANASGEGKRESS